MKTTLCGLILVVGLAAAAALGQTNGPLEIEWQQSFGGSGDDLICSVQQTSDHGFILAGSSFSPVSGSKTSALYGQCDYWIVRLDAEGNKVWEAACGGTGEEGFVNIQEGSDGGFLLAGYSTSSNNGTKTCNNFGIPGDAARGYSDIWLVRLDSLGRQYWNTNVGSSSFDLASGLLVRKVDGSFTIGGHSRGGVSGTRTSPNHGSYDLWLAHFDADGRPLWDQSFGGSDYELSGCFALNATANGGFILGGASWSAPSGNKTSPKYSTVGYDQEYASDYWVVRTDADGSRLWDATFGARGGASRLDDIASLPDGGFLLVGWSTAPPATGTLGNKTSPRFGAKDGWIVRIDAEGKLLWDQSFGGAGTDRFSAVAVMPDGGFLLAGESDSKAGGNKTSPCLGGSDFWVVRVDAQGNKLWEQTFGGTAIEGLWSAMSFSSVRLVPTLDGGFLLAGVSNSPKDGMKTSAAFGGLDYWVLKLAPEPPCLRVGAMQPDGLPLTLIGPTNGTYVIQCADTCSAAASNWRDLATVASPTGQLQWTDTEACGAPTRFYRAVRP